MKTLSQTKQQRLRSICSLVTVVSYAELHCNFVFAMRLCTHLLFIIWHFVSGVYQLQSCN